MDKNLLSSLVVTFVFFLGAAVQLVREKTGFAIVGFALGTVYLVLTLIGYKKTKDNEKKGSGDSAG